MRPLAGEHSHQRVEARRGSGGVNLYVGQALR